MDYRRVWERVGSLTDETQFGERRMLRILKDDIPSFMEVEIAKKPSDLSGADVVIVGFPYQGVKILDRFTFLPETASVPPNSIYCRGGAEQAPDFVRKYSVFYSMLSSGGHVPEVTRDLRITDWLTVKDYGDIELVFGDVEESNANAVECLKEILQVGAVPIVIGGDHQVSTPVFKALTETREGSMGIVVFDSHFDMYSEPKYWAGSQWARAFESGRLSPEHFIQIGIRGTRHATSEPRIAEELGYRYFTLTEVEERGIKSVCQEALERLKGVDHIHLSLDVDVIDPAFCPGQRYPDPGGLTSREILSAIRYLSAHGLSAMDVACLSPLYDLNGISSQLIARCIVQAIAMIAEAKRNATNP